MADSNSDSLDSLAALFPDLERDILSAMLDHHQSVERVVSALLDDGSEQADDADATAARNLQAEYDEEVARGMQEEERQAAASATSAAQSAQPAAQSAAAAAERVAAGTKRLLQLGQQRIRQLSSKNRNAHGQRLLEDTPIASDQNEPLSALQPLYTPPPPQYEVPAPPPVSPRPTPPPVSPMTTSSTRTGGDGTSAQSSASPPPQQYSSRVERARLANRSKTPSMSQGLQPLPSSLTPPSPAIPPLAQGPVEVPVGELI